MSYQLRDYQVEAIDSINDMESNKPGLIVLSTGAGKTVVMADVAARNTSRTLIILPSTELREQTIEKLKETNPDLDIGSVQGSLDEVSNKIVCSTRQSLTHSKSTRIQRMISYGEFGLIIFDEAHQAVSQISKILSKIDTTKSKIVGFTATPFSKDITNVFKEILYSKDILYMIDNNYLVEPKVIQISTKTSLAGVKTTAGEFNQRSLELTVNNDYRNDLIVKAYKEFASDRKHTLVFASGIEHCEDLTKEFINQGIKCNNIDSTLSQVDRDKVLKQYKTGKIDVLCNVGVLTTGFDDPQTNCIIYARPTKSKILFTQILGRGLRIFKDKVDCLVMDFKDVCSSHDLMDMESLFDVNFKKGQTLNEAREDKRHEAEIVRIEREKIEIARIEQLELVAKQIKLFNKEMHRAFTNVSYDWMKVSPNIYAVSESSDHHMAIESGNGEFLIYKVTTKKDNKAVEYVDSFENVTDAIQYVEDNIMNPKSFAYPDAEWKKDAATANQKKYVPWSKTKWDCHKFFTSNSIRSQLRNY